ncbi:MAG: DUF3616 domain-containing protein [Pseudomonadota bacterium]|uniref:DUF3616 domain-containing protein n=1 Tax=Polaromonas sp. TaxID=1869339 RepID=UPI001792228C|nr:DUF3616 domain-containing protein [Polaromonas sp.]MBA3595717.1 DUF3616 domain-containing protein [Polaromonas sp.]MDQ3272494.1 DUF3616 domain-containing protein [Pseudomonadota bacterium]
MPISSAAVPRFLPLTDIYEPSAIQQLADGRFLVVEDEQAHPFSLITLNADGTCKSRAVGPGWFEGNDTFWKLDDLEGLTADRQGYLYALTSHSRNDNGEEKKNRDKLVRFRIDGDRVREPLVASGLKPALVEAHPVLATAARIEDVKLDGGLNIEALEITPDGQRLLVGLRSPLLDGAAIIASIDNPSAIFEANEAPLVAKDLLTLDLGGQGIRGMAWTAALSGYLIISGPASLVDQTFGLWFWSGQPLSPARRVVVPGLQHFARAEGVSAALIDGVPYIVIVSDDGKRHKGRFAHFVLLEPGQLQIAP